METGFSLNNRPKRALNTLGYHHFPDIRLKFTIVRPILKKPFHKKFNIFNIGRKTWQIQEHPARNTLQMKGVVVF